MKKLFLAIVLAAAASFAHAQDNPVLMSKNGTPILPETGEWAIGFDAAPFFDVIKGLFSSSDSVSSTYTNFTRNHPLTIYGKKVKDASTIWRAGARLGFGSTKTEYPILRDSIDNTPPTLLDNQVYVNDRVKVSYTNIRLGFGIEKRKGKGRIQGYYGPELWLGMGSAKTTHEFANQFSGQVLDSVSGNVVAGNEDPSTAIPNAIIGTTPQGHNIYVNEGKTGSTLSIGLRGFVGVEYFFMAKASIGLELGWGLMFSRTGEATTSTVFWDDTLNSNAGGTRENTVPGDATEQGRGQISSFGIDTDNAAGALNFFFYF